MSVPFDTAPSAPDGSQAPQAAAPLLSVIIPIYNVAPYLDECLTSVRAQTLRDIEIICVNDGSTDGSLAIIQRHAAEDERFVVIDKPNAGYGHTMNRGLDSARGSFVGIVESDDWIEADMFESLLAAATTCDAEIARSDFYLSWTQPALDERYFSSLPNNVEAPCIDPLVDYAIIQTQPAVWCSIYRRSFLAEHGIRFRETAGASFQDTSFSLKAFSTAERVAYLRRAFYHYRQDNLSASTRSTQKVFTVVEELDDYRAYLEGVSEDTLGLLPQRKAKLLDILQGIIYKTYRWNTLRIDESVQPEFVSFARDYFVPLLAAGALKEEYFEEEFYREMRLLVKDPDAWLRLISPAQGFSGKLGKLGTFVSVHGLSKTVRRVQRMFSKAGSHV